MIQVDVLLVVLYFCVPLVTIPPARLTALSVLLLSAAVQSSVLQVVASRVGWLFPATLISGNGNHVTVSEYEDG